jgi:4-amino-4-deoxy-L-arabinose transferase-like glycosyltransferase
MDGRVPLTDWSFRLLAMANAGLALFAVDMIARRFVRGDRRAVILLLLLLTPVYQFHAEKFNANSVLLAIWPLATYCFLRSFEERTAGWAAAAGFLCALAMLGKYYSIFLLAGFVIAAILHPDRARYLRSTAPWISVACGLIGIAPHIYWLSQNDFMPFYYAAGSHIGKPGVQTIKDSALFVLTNAAYLPAACCLLPAACCLLPAACGLSRRHAALEMARVGSKPEGAAFRPFVAASGVRDKFPADAGGHSLWQRSACDMAFSGPVLCRSDFRLCFAF